MVHYLWTHSMYIDIKSCYLGLSFLYMNVRYMFSSKVNSIYSGIKNIWLLMISTLQITGEFEFVPNGIVQLYYFFSSLLEWCTVANFRVFSSSFSLLHREKHLIIPISINRLSFINWPFIHFFSFNGV